MTRRGSRAEPDARPDVSGAVTGVVVRYVRERKGQTGVRRVLEMAGEKRRPSTLEDPTTWSSYDRLVALVDSAARILRDPDSAFHFGREMLRQYRDTEIGALLQLAGPIDAVFSTALRGYELGEPAVTFKVLEIVGEHAQIRAVTARVHRLHIYMCDLRKGYISEIPTFFGAAPARIEESECQARGGQSCLYSLTWMAQSITRPSPEPEVAQVRRIR
jgi:hypothetical protein